MDVRLPKPAQAAGPRSLAAWYADPLAPHVAAALHDTTEQALQGCLRAGEPCFRLRLQQLLCRFWLTQVSSHEYEQLQVAAAGAAERALLELVYGQLLISRKQRQATRHLARGFSLAAPQLNAVDYFRLVRRHELLGYLCLSNTASQPLPLDKLLAEAAVIRRLQQGGGRWFDCAHSDTVG